MWRRGGGGREQHRFCSVVAITICLSCPISCVTQHISLICVLLSVLQAKAAGKMLFDQVCKQLNLLETDYFGLEYMDVQGVTVSALNFFFKDALQGRSVKKWGHDLYQYLVVQLLTGMAEATDIFSLNFVQLSCK